MTVNQALREAILPLVPVCEPDDYGGDATEYCTFAYDDQPTFYADGVPFWVEKSVELNWYLPNGIDPISKKKQICNAIVAAGFSFPVISNLSDDASQHYLYEFSWFNNQA